MYVDITKTGENITISKNSVALGGNDAAGRKERQSTIRKDSILVDEAAVIKHASVCKQCHVLKVPFCV